MGGIKGGIDLGHKASATVHGFTDEDAAEAEVEEDAGASGERARERHEGDVWLCESFEGGEYGLESSDVGDFEEQSVEADCREQGGFFGTRDPGDVELGCFGHSALTKALATADPKKRSDRSHNVSRNPATDSARAGRRSVAPAGRARVRIEIKKLFEFDPGVRTSLEAGSAGLG
jgi:hypothetical protein